MIKKKIGRPPKKKPIETFQEEVVSETVVAPAPVKHEKVCECGQPAQAGHHQCYACSHRS